MNQMRTAKRFDPARLGAVANEPNLASLGWGRPQGHTATPRTRRWLAFVLCLAAIASLSGCARSGERITTIRTEADVPPSPLVAPLIIADEASLELRGPELTPEGRAKFREERPARVSARIRPAPQPRFSAGEFAAGCLMAGAMTFGLGLIACPIVLPVTVVSTHMARASVNGVKYAVASMQEPGLRLSDDQAARMGATLRERATSAALVERALHNAPGAFARATQAESLLVVRLKAAWTCEVEDAAAICLAAEARAFLGDGIALPSTEHVFIHGPLLALATAEPGHLNRTIDEALDLLAESVVAAYTGMARPPEPLQQAAPAPESRPDRPRGLGKLTDEERSVFPKTSSSGCFRDGC